MFRKLSHLAFPPGSDYGVRLSLSRSMDELIKLVGMSLLNCSSSTLLEGLRHFNIIVNIMASVFGPEVLEDMHEEWN